MSLKDQKKVLGLLVPKRLQMNSPTIVVVGSTNTDMVIKASHLPQPGETILGGTFFMSAGGKGANQAVAAARLGGSVTFIAKTGYDIFGKQSMELFEKEGIDVSGIQRDHHQPSGVALITVDEKGENCIVVAPGANAALTPGDIDEMKEKIENASLLLVQLETPLETVIIVFALLSSVFLKSMSFSNCDFKTKRIHDLQNHIQYFHSDGVITREEAENGLENR